MQPQNDTTPERPARRIRRENLLRLVAECETTRSLANKTGTVETHLIAIQKGRRGLGDELAQKLEAGTGKPYGWMDLEHLTGNQQPIAEPAPSALFDRRRTDRGDLDDLAAGQGS